MNTSSNHNNIQNPLESISAELQQSVKTIENTFTNDIDHSTVNDDGNDAQKNKTSKAKSFLKNFLLWFDTEAKVNPEEMTSEKFNWVRCLPFIILHLGVPLGIYLTGYSHTALVFCILFYLIRMFTITGFYHRYFSHKSFKTNRFWQFTFAFIGGMSLQRGALWWAAHHRHHHQHSDTEKDLHSPKRGFWWSHMGWFCCDASFPTRWNRIKDLAKFPELVWLNRYDLFAPAVFAAFTWALGSFLNFMWPELGTSGFQMFVWGFVISTVLLFHGTVTINSLGHIWGKQRFKSEDNSRNNLFLAFITLGEGWHNNHHRYSISARQGFYWWEVDITYGILKIMEKLNMISDLRPVPAKVLEEGRLNKTQSNAVPNRNGRP